MDRLHDIQRLFSSPSITVDQYLEGLDILRKLKLSRRCFERINYVALLKRPYKTLRARPGGISKDQKDIAMAKAKLVIKHIKDLPLCTYKDVPINPGEASTSDIVRINIRRALTGLLEAKAKELDETMEKERKERLHKHQNKIRNDNKNSNEDTSKINSEPGVNASGEVGAASDSFEEDDDDAMILNPFGLAMAIEINIYKTFGKVGDEYKEFYRMLDTAFLNEDNEKLVRCVLQGHISAEELAHFSVEDFESDAQKMEREKNIKLYKALANRQALADQMAIATDEYTCSKCHSNRCSYEQKQLRSSDEPMTIIVTCLSCRHTWRIN